MAETLRKRHCRKPRQGPNRSGSQKKRLLDENGVDLSRLSRTGSHASSSFGRFDHCPFGDDVPTHVVRISRIFDNGLDCRSSGTVVGRNSSRVRLEGTNLLGVTPGVDCLEFLGANTCLSRFGPEFVLASVAGRAEPSTGAFSSGPSVINHIGNKTGADT